MVSLTLLIAGVLGLLLGLALYTTRPNGILQNRAVFAILNVVVNIVRPIPFIILISALLPVTRAVVGTHIGTNAAIFVMIVAATFYIGRIVEQNLVAIDPGVIEAVRAAGARPGRIILSVLIPEALGPLILGYTFVVIGIVDMSALAGIIGGRGIGDFALVNGYNVFRWDVTLVATAVIIILVQGVQFLGNWLARKALRY
ncbi:MULTISPECIES: methionine ABC transporter permease [unclassified Cryobacterium]|uniref:methionine ABC transporter permease n=1 Tax=unclassified Cryobacterium TaxID=2649013 RepID=UPI001B2FF147|nr:MULTISPECIES: methionine ABC transporter permease [unclassified Cryobacterium]